MTTTPDIETDRLPGVAAPGSRPRAPFGGKRALYNVVPVRFERSFVSELYNAGELLLDSGEHVVVDTPKGPVLAEVCGIVERRVLERGQVGRIIRRATGDDVERHEDNRALAREAFRFCVTRIRARKLKMKLCQVEYMLDRSRVLFYFSAERRVDFRQLVRDLARQLDARIEMRQIGVRDGAGLIGGIGPCGKELCCSSFLTSFRSISIRHAKDQGLTLNPKKVSGMCGRLMCCLVYEHPTYRKAKKGAPRVNRAVSTALGEGVVTEVQLLQRRVRVLLEGGSSETFPFSEVVVDNDTVRRARDIQAMPSRPRRQMSLTREGSNLREEYVWDDAEAADVEITGDIESSDSTKERRRSRSNQSRKRRSKRGSGRSRRSRRRRSRGKRRSGSKSKAQGGEQKSGESQKSDGKKRSSGGRSGSKRSRSRRRRRNRSRRSKGGDQSGQKAEGNEQSSGGQKRSGEQTGSGGQQRSKTKQASGDGKSGSSRRRRRRRRRRGSKRGGSSGDKGGGSGDKGGGSSSS